MPIIKSAKKRVRVARKASARNARTKKLLKTSVKSFNSKPTSDSLGKAISSLDLAVKKGVMHKNKAARKKRQLAAAAKAKNVKLNAKKATAKPAAKKTIAKPTAKKAPAKKPVAKKSQAKKATKK